MPYYLAYGSNLHPLRLQQRLGAVTPVARLRLAGQALRFHKRGADHSAKCDLVVATGKTQGLLYRLSDAQLRRLDRFEGGYRRTTLIAALPQGRVAVVTYRAERALIEPTLRPFDWYLELIRLGGEALAFGAAFGQALAGITPQTDPDAARAAAQRALLERLRQHQDAALQRLPWGSAQATSTIE